jgi:AcrR family transcriptional regulator
MGRPAKFSEGQILDAALEILAEQGPGGVTMAAIASWVGAPTGSLYHRFGSRDLLVATLWLRTVQEFQQGFLAALANGDVEAAALHTPRWCREHPRSAALLLMYRREDLAVQWPEELGEQLARLNDGVSAALDDFVARNGLDRERAVFALVDVPYGAVHRHLAQRRPPPASVDELVLSVCRSVLSA